MFCFTNARAGKSLANIKSRDLPGANLLPSKVVPPVIGGMWPSGNFGLNATSFDIAGRKQDEGKAI